jgi:quinohemoprotein amine dehydrogenase
VRATGQPQEVKLFGLNFPQNVAAENLALGAGMAVQAVTQSGDDTIVARVVVDKEAKVGPREVKVAGVEGKGTLFVYKKADYLKILPERAYARPGGVRTPKVYQQFEALLFANGPDGKKGTKDDINLGRVSPVKWSLEEYVDRISDDDVYYVGTIDENGLFVPAQDGPNPQREMSHGNVGSVWVEAAYLPQEAQRPLRARAYLLAMPPKFNFQAID